MVLLQGLAVATAIQQLGFNWFSFYRARGESRPQAVEAAVMAGAFLAFAVPGLALWGATGFVVGRSRGVGGHARSCARATCTGCCRACGSGRSACADRCRWRRAPRQRFCSAAGALGRRAAALAGAGRDRRSSSASRRSPRERSSATSCGSSCATSARATSRRRRREDRPLRPAPRDARGRGALLPHDPRGGAAACRTRRSSLLSPEEPDPAAWRRLGIEVEDGAFAWVRAMDREVTEASARSSTCWWRWSTTCRR